MAFPDSFLDELTARTDIEELISGYVGLKRRGNSLLGLCPFHSEKTPSFTVSPDKQLYYCFGCGAGGGVIQFVMQAENLDFADSVSWLAGRAGLQVPDDREDAQARRLRDRIYTLHVEAARFYHKILTDNAYPEASAYLKRRGITAKTARNFGLGAAPAGNMLMEAMLSQGFTKSELLAAGLAAQNSKGEVYDRFRGRLMFPILNVQRKVIAFGGRILTDGQPKYLNSPDTPVFSKSRNLFALNFAKNSKQKGLLLAEGYMDVISLHQAGFDNAVASLGTALTEQQVHLMRKYAPEVTLAYDMDTAGQGASRRASELLEKAGIKVSVLVLEGAKDPDEFISKYGAGALAGRLDKREGRLEHRLSQLTAAHDMNDDRGRIGFLQEASKVLAGITGEIEREVYTGRVAALAGVQPEAVRLEIKRLRTYDMKKERRREERQTASPVRRAAPPGTKPGDVHAARAEEELLQMVMNDPSILPEFADRLSPEDFSTPFLGRIWEQMAFFRQNDTAVSIAALSQTLSPEEVSHLTRVLHRPSVRAQTRQAAEDCLGIILRESAARAAAAQGEDPILARALQQIEKKRETYGGAHEQR